MNHYPQNGQMGDTKPPNNMLHKAKHISSNILSYILHIGSNEPATSLTRSYLQSLSLYFETR